MLPSVLNIGPFSIHSLRVSMARAGAALAGRHRPGHSRRRMLAALVALGMAGGGAT